MYTLVIPAQCNTNNITTHKLNRVEHLELEWGTYIAGSAVENRVEDICAVQVELTRPSGTYDTVAVRLYSHCEVLLAVPLKHASA